MQAYRNALFGDGPGRRLLLFDRGVPKPRFWNSVILWPGGPLGGLFRGVLAPLEAFLGAFWGALGPSCGLLGRLLGCLAAVFRCLIVVFQNRGFGTP